jgi:acyl carrier protein
VYRTGLPTEKGKTMTLITHYQPEAIAELLRTHIQQELAYDRPHLVLTNDFQLVEQGVIDSMALLRMMNFIEERFNIALEPEDLMIENFATIEAMTAFITDRLAMAT